MPYPHLFSEWQIRNTTIANRVVFAPTCPTWVANPYDGVFTDQAVAYYEERAKGGCGLIIIGGTVIHPSAPMPKELEDHEIEEILGWYESAAQRAIAAGLDGVEFHMSHGYLPWQFLSPLYNHRTDRWGGSYENRLRFPVEAMTRIRAAIGDEPFMGYRINSTSFWPGDLELQDIQRIVGDLERECDVDFVDLSAGVHHSYIHTPMTYEDGWEREYTRAVKTVSTKPVLLVGRITRPDVAEELLESGDADGILPAGQMFADAEWAAKARDGKDDDIRRCVAANYCWRSVIRGGRVQCIYNPEVGRERKWGAGTLDHVADGKRVLVA